MKKTELLAPVGGFEALIAAVQNGADAVYLGGKSFGARQNASNFDEEELKRAVEYCHIRGVRVYVTVNTLIANHELEVFMKYIELLYNIDVDAVIVQDLGALKFIRDNYPDFEVHASTQMTIHNLEGIKLLKDLGVKRVVAAREMSVQEIQYIKKKEDMELEVFVHGALCICYSGQCLMSSLIGGRSGNRGTCAQPCRLPYKLVELSTGREMKNEFGDYILSPRDLNTIENIEDLLKLGVDSLKIEGRMKRPEYVAIVVGIYRQAIDMYYEKGTVQITESMKRDLEGIFNRRFTKGYVFGDSGKELMSFEKPGNRGIEIGKIDGYNHKTNKTTIKLTDILNKGDGIKIKTNDDEVGMIVNAIYYNGSKIDRGNKGQIVEIDLRGKVDPGNAIFKTSDIQLLNKAKDSYDREHKTIPIHGVVKGKLGENLMSYIWDDDGHYCEIMGTIEIEKARNVAIDENRIEAQMNKLGDTPYRFEDLEIEIDDGISISLSEINKIRRELIGKLDVLRGNLNNRNRHVVDTSSFTRADAKKQRVKSNDRILISGYATSVEQLNTLVYSDIDIIYYSCAPKELEEIYRIAKVRKKKLIPALNRISNDRELKASEAGSYKDSVLVSNLGQLNLLKNKNIEMHADFSLNIYNSLAVRKFKELGVKHITLSPELTLNQIKEITDYGEGEYEVIGYGHLPMMITEYCPINSINKEEKNCSRCSSISYGLKDRYGFVFPIKREANCRTSILNSQKLFTLEFLNELTKSGIDQIRLQFTNEDKSEIINIVNTYKLTLDSIYRGDNGMSQEVLKLIDYYKSKNDYTKGHFYRGIL